MEYVALGYRNLIAQPVNVKNLPKTGLSGLLEDVGLDDLLDSLDMAPFEEAGTDIRLHLSATGIGRINIFERIEVGHDRVVFRLISRSGERYATKGGPFLEAHSGNESFPQGALLLRWYAEPNDTLVFHEVWLPEGGVALETPFGTFVTAENNGKVSEIVVDRDVIGEWQRFEYLVPPEGLLPPPAPVERDESLAERLQSALEDDTVSATARVPVSTGADLSDLLEDTDLKRKPTVVGPVDERFASLIEEAGPQREARRIDPER